MHGLDHTLPVQGISKSLGAVGKNDLHICDTCNLHILQPYHADTHCQEHMIIQNKASTYYLLSLGCVSKIVYTY